VQVGFGQAHDWLQKKRSAEPAGPAKAGGTRQKAL
jgi:hypothetical protein